MNITVEAEDIFRPCGSQVIPVAASVEGGSVEWVETDQSIVQVNVGWCLGMTVGLENTEQQ